MRTKARPSDPAEHLGTSEAWAEYISVVLETTGPVLIADSLSVAARASSMSRLARDTRPASLPPSQRLQASVSGLRYLILDLLSETIFLAQSDAVDSIHNISASLLAFTPTERIIPRSSTCSATRAKQYLIDPLCLFKM